MRGAYISLVRCLDQNNERPQKGGHVSKTQQNRGDSSAFGYLPPTYHNIIFISVPFPLSSGKTGWLFCMMLVKRSPLPALKLDLTQQHMSVQKEALKGKYHGAGMP